MGFQSIVYRPGPVARVILNRNRVVQAMAYLRDDRDRS